MPEWNTTERGKTREDQDKEYEDADWDGKSCMDHHLLPGRGIRDVEDLTMLSGLQARAETEDEES